MEIKNEAQQIIITYCKKWYGTTGDIVKDFKIILNNIYSTENWSVTDICEILLNNFEELAKDEIRILLNETIFDRYDMDKEDIKIKFLKSLKSIIGLTEAVYFEGLNKEDYKELFNLKEVK
jgi:hypothetical protein